MNKPTITFKNGSMIGYSFTVFNSVMREWVKKEFMHRIKEWDDANGMHET